jgi:hypothetical protein
MSQPTILFHSIITSALSFKLQTLTSILNTLYRRIDERCRCTIRIQIHNVHTKLLRSVVEHERAVVL